MFMLGFSAFGGSTQPTTGLIGNEVKGSLFIGYISCLNEKSGFW